MRERTLYFILKVELTEIDSDSLSKVIYVIQLVKSNPYFLIKSIDELVIYVQSRFF